MTFGQAAAQLRADRPRIVASIHQGIEKIGMRAKAVAVQRSSGPFSLAELARRDYPYARRHGSSGLNPSMINVQSGAFRADWNLYFTGPTSMSLVNHNKVANFLKDGTMYMVARPIDVEIVRIVQRAAPGIFIRATGGVFTK